MESTDFSILKWGVAGCGRISNDFVGALQSEPSPQVHRFVAVASARSLESGQKFATHHNIGRWYASYTELANDTEVQVVYVANWNMDHFGTAKLFLEHGKHVLVEKPMTMNEKQTQALVALARAKNLFLMEALWSRFTPSYQFALEQIRSGAIGSVVHVGIEMGVPIAKVEQIARKDTGGGAILNIGCYPLNLVLQAFDHRQPTQIKAVGQLNEHGIDQAVGLVLNFADGGTATIAMDVRVSLSNEARVTGTGGYIRFDDSFHCPERLVVNGKEHRFQLPPTIVPMNYGASSGLRYQAHEVRRCLVAGVVESSTMSHQHSIMLAKIEDEIRRQLGIVFAEDS